MNHSKLPWKVKEAKDGWQDSPFVSIVDNNGDEIFAPYCDEVYGNYVDSFPEDAAYIVKACNLFPKLVSALERADKKHCAICRAEHDMPQEYCATCKGTAGIKALLDECKGEK